MPDRQQLIEAIDRTREQAGFLTVEATLALQGCGNMIFDPFSTLISRRAVIGEGNVFHPNVRVVCGESANLHVGSGNTFHSNTVIEAAVNAITIGDRNQFGEGMVCIKANAPGAAIDVGDSGRFCGVITLYGRITLGSGAQILGNITAHNCSLGDGKPHSHPVADDRGAVLKGTGFAKGIHLARGQVIAGWGTFQAEDAVPQSTFHPSSG